MTDRALVESEFRALHRAFCTHIRTVEEWARPAEPMIVGTYNDTVSRARQGGVATAPGCDEFPGRPSYATLLEAMERQLAFLQSPTGRYVLHGRVTPLPPTLPMARLTA